MYEEEPELPTHSQIRELRRDHIALAASRLARVIGRGLMSLQWVGILTFDDLALDPEDTRATVISRLSEKDMREVIKVIEGKLHKAGYCYDFDLMKYDSKPYFQITYELDFYESDKEDEEDHDVVCGGHRRAAKADTERATEPLEYFSDDGSSGEDSDISGCDASGSDHETGDGEDGSLDFLRSWDA